jgi:elongator complex protein 4
MLTAIGRPSNEASRFCHALDLTTSLPNPKLTFLPPSAKTGFPDLNPLLTYLNANQNGVARVVLPSLLSPLYYPAAASTEPGPPLRFFASLRQLVQKFPNLVIMLSWPLALFGSFNALTQGMERFVHGVIALQVFPHGFSTFDEDMAPTLSKSEAERDKMEMQGLITVRKLPILSDRGMGLSRAADGGDWAFAIGRRKMVVRPFDLPPLGGADEPAPSQAAGAAKKDSLEF